MTFPAFFDGVYLPAHRRPLTRYLHFVGTIGAIGFTLAALFAWDAWWLIGAPVWGYGWAWPAHWFVEGNQPETFKKPIPSLGGDLLMLLCWCVGALSANLAQSRNQYPEKWR